MSVNPISRGTLAFYLSVLSILFPVPTIRECEVNEMDLESLLLHTVHQIEIVVLVQDETHEP